MASTVKSWLCTNSTKNMLVKIVHPGGHVELHDRPVLAAEILHRNPKCCVAHPNVFQQPWAIVAPDTTLNLGQKFYVVPVNTIRKLQRLSLKNCPNSNMRLQEIQTASQSCSSTTKDDNDGAVSCCRLFTNNKSQYCCVKESDHDDNSCLVCLLKGMKMKGKSSTREDSSKEAGSSSSSSSSIGASETKRLTKDKKEDVQPRRSLSTLDHWQPNLESIKEE